MANADTHAGSSPQLALVPGLESMRVVHIPEFLPTRQRDAFFQTLCENHTSFHPPGGPGSQSNGTLYLSSETDPCDHDPGNSIHAAWDGLSKRIEAVLPDLFTILGVTPFAVPKVPLSVVNGLNGHGGIPHSDESGGRFQISLLYYVHRIPKPFQGGDLDFYAADPGSATGYGEQAVSRIIHQDNLLVAFPSHVFHGITEVQCESDDFADGRFAVVGFLGPP